MTRRAVCELALTGATLATLACGPTREDRGSEQDGGRAEDSGPAPPVECPSERDVWRRMTDEGAPSPRFWHAMVWTGTEVIVWGESDFGSNLGDGARWVAP